ncbi:hypothetical protein A9K97_gp295 [Tokyovirus A1]|uniref:hypothetical protein n=1 Tax=Tokyovirus A1 TaxID=1826170 RepID=UPI0007A96A9C|nr:hypothetical protein A9K97_gp295 [Tokyovirus A1]BAU80056.1 hypothetical protein [Tokyovirus A1]
MSEFYLVSSCEERPWSPPNLYALQSTKELLSFLEEFFGRGEEIFVVRITKDGKWNSVKEYDDFVDAVEEKDLFGEIYEKDGIHSVKKARSLFCAMKKKLKTLPDVKGIEEEKLFACDECQVVTEKLTSCEDDECVCLHSCGCNKLREISFL